MKIVMSPAERSEIAALAADSDYRLTQVLVRCGGCRFVCTAQDVAFLTRAVETAGDYVRDVSLAEVAA